MLFFMTHEILAFPHYNFQLFLELTVQGFSRTTSHSLSECQIRCLGIAAFDKMGHDGRFCDVKGIV